jgi:hypothetical protein
METTERTPADRESHCHGAANSARTWNELGTTSA